MTAGERRFAARLQGKLEDDYLCWYDVPLGPRQLHPDFVIVHPTRGLLILEVKDWRLEHMKQATRAEVRLLTNEGLVSKPNPIEQARQYAFGVVKLLERDPLLTVAEGDRHAGNLLFPYGHGVVFTRISRRQFERAELGQVIDPERVICEDEMTETVDPEAFQKRLWAMFTVRCPHTLTLPQLDRLRWHLFPEIRINPGQLSLLEEPAPEASIADTVPDLIRVMDVQQEQLARSLGEGHRVIHGVAGSGKTLILGYRCLHLAKALRKPILVLCYNVTLAAKLTQIVEEKGLSKQVSVRNFHGWCSDQLRTYHVAKPPRGPEFFDQLVQKVIDNVERGQIPAGQYGAVMIDEGHDFRPEWLKLVTQMVDPETRSLLVLYDNAQSIYGRGPRRKFSFASVGIKAQGRTTILRLNYRNTAEVLGVAQAFAREILSPEDADEHGIPLIAPESAGRHGPVPQLIRLPNLKSEANYLADQLRTLHEHGAPWKEMAIVYRAHFIGEEVVRSLRAANVPVEWLSDDESRRHFRPAEDSVKVMTMHSSKGLEFPLVAVPGLGFMPHANDDPREEARLLYVAMTRAMDHLILTCHRDSEFAIRLTAASIRTAA